MAAVVPSVLTGVFWFRCQSVCPSPSGGSSGAPAFLLEAHLSEKKRIVLSFPMEPFVLLLASRWTFMSKRSFAKKLVSLQTCCVVRDLSHHGTIKLTIAWHPLAVYEDGIIVTTPIALRTPVWKPRDWFHGHLDLPVPFQTRRSVVLKGKQWLGRLCKLWPNTRPPTGNDWLQ